MTKTVWSEDGVACGRLTAKLASGDSEGLSVSWDEKPLLSRLFAALAPSGPLPEAIERYSRGDDRFSLHPASDSFPFRTQLGWSVTPCQGDALRLTLTVSLQTDPLDTRPGLVLATGVSGEPLPGTSAWRLDVGPNAVVLAAPHPSDAAETLAESHEGEFRLTLSPPFLEKGVIRRCRLAAMVLPSGADEAAIQRALVDFAEAPLPLTA